MYVIYLHTELHIPVRSGLISYRYKTASYKTASYKTFSLSRSLLVVHSTKHFHNNICIFLQGLFPYIISRL